jgi:hypothetical protein
MACDWFLVALSPHSAKSEWVKDELHWAMDNKQGRIIPVLIEPCELQQFHIRLPRIQVLNFASNREASQEKLVNLLKSDVQPLTPETIVASPMLVEATKQQAAGKKKAIFKLRIGRYNCLSISVAITYFSVLIGGMLGLSLLSWEHESVPMAEERPPIIKRGPPFRLPVGPPYRLPAGPRVIKLSPVGEWKQVDNPKIALSIQFDRIRVTNKESLLAWGAHCRIRNDKLLLDEFHVPNKEGLLFPSWFPVRFIPALKTGEPFIPVSLEISFRLEQDRLLLTGEEEKRPTAYELVKEDKMEDSSGKVSEELQVSIKKLAHEMGEVLVRTIWPDGMPSESEILLLKVPDGGLSARVALSVKWGSRTEERQTTVFSFEVWEGHLGSLTVLSSSFRNQIDTKLLELAETNLRKLWSSK